MFLTDRSHLPDTVTSYDVWKTLAVLLMIIDHIGAYFLPDEQGLRILGRLCVPIWFFLVGYAQSRDLSWRLWAGVAILSISNYIGGVITSSVIRLLTKWKCGICSGSITYPEAKCGRHAFWKIRSKHLIPIINVIPYKRINIC